MSLQAIESFGEVTKKGDGESKETSISKALEAVRKVFPKAMSITCEDIVDFDPKTDKWKFKVRVIEPKI